MTNTELFKEGVDVTGTVGSGGVTEGDICILTTGNVFVRAGANATNKKYVAKYTAAATATGVFMSGSVYAVNYAAAANAGTPLLTAAAGTVTPTAGAVADARLSAGHCWQDIAAPGVGFAYIYN